MREAWTDERLDDLNQRVMEGFTRVDGDLRELRTDMKDLRRELNRGFLAITGLMLTGFLAIAGLMVG